MIPCQLPQLFADNLTAASTDTSVNFVKDKGWGRISSGENGLEGEHQARCFTTRSGLCKRLERFSGIGRDQKLDAINPSQVAGVGFSCLTVDAGRDALFAGYLLGLNSEPGTSHV